ncbi:MAG: autotransporter outer membrane beta-barrel domain-containing protein [Bacteroidota bacterium]
MKALRVLFPFVFSMLLFTGLQAQFGVKGSYLTSQADQWEYDAPFGSERIELLGSGWQLGVDYWFRLKNTRIEFLPTLAFSSQEQSIGSEPSTLETQVQGVHFFFNTNIYFLDLSGDCDCPTFSKQGPTLQKGLFLQISPGYSLFNFEIDEGAGRLTFDGNNGAFSIGAGLGFDLGFSDLFTLSPMASLRYYPTVTWDELTDTGIISFPPEVEAESTVINYELGLRLGFRLDN